MNLKGLEGCFINEKKELSFGLFFSGIFQCISKDIKVKLAKSSDFDESTYFGESKIIFEYFLLFLDRDCHINSIENFYNNFTGLNFINSIYYCNFFLSLLKENKIVDFYYTEYWLQLTDSLIAIGIKEFLSGEFSAVGSKFIEIQVLDKFMSEIYESIQLKLFKYSENKSKIEKSLVLEQLKNKNEWPNYFSQVTSVYLRESKDDIVLLDQFDFLYKLSGINNAIATSKLNPTNDCDSIATFQAFYTDPILYILNKIYKNNYRKQKTGDNSGKKIFQEGMFGTIDTDRSIPYIPFKLLCEKKWVAAGKNFEITNAFYETKPLSYHFRNGEYFCAHFSGTTGYMLITPAKLITEGLLNIKDLITGVPYKALIYNYLSALISWMVCARDHSLYEVIWMFEFLNLGYKLIDYENFEIEILEEDDVNALVEQIYRNKNIRSKYIKRIVKNVSWFYSNVLFNKGGVIVELINAFNTEISLFEKK